MRMWILMLLLGLSTAGCGTTCPQVSATRCSGTLVEVCGSNKKWQRVMDCKDVKPISPKAAKQWTCGTTTTGCTCVPAGGVQ